MTPQTSIFSRYPTFTCRSRFSRSNLACEAPLVVRTGAERDLCRELVVGGAVDVDSGFVAFVVDTSPRSRVYGRSPSTRVEGVCGSAVSPRIIFRGVGGPLIAFHSAYPSTAGSDYDTSHLISFPATSPRRQHAGRASTAPLSFRARARRACCAGQSLKSNGGLGLPAGVSRRVAARCREGLGHDAGARCAQPGLRFRPRGPRTGEISGYK